MNYNGVIDKTVLKRLVTQVYGEGWYITPLYYYCTRCGKRVCSGIHTCTLKEALNENISDS